MSIDRERIHQIMRYAVAVASHEDDFRRRELGPIHLVKYVYLADLAHARKHGGATYTGVPWRFYHFGPWTTEVWQELEPAMDLPAIHRRSFEGRYQDDVSRWKSEEPELEESLEEALPFTVARAVKSAVHEFSNDTAGLLHHVYRTPPMLCAAPEESLDFLTALPKDDDVGRLPVQEETAPALSPRGDHGGETLSKTARKRRKAAHDDLRARFQEALKKSREARRAMPKPRPPVYDELFFKGQEWLDSLAGDPITPTRGELIVSEEIWKSPTRSDPGIP